jgi:hypothetical protein
VDRCGLHLREVKAVSRNKAIARWKAGELGWRGLPDRVAMPPHIAATGGGVVRCEAVGLGAAPARRVTRTLRARSPVLVRARLNGAAAPDRRNLAAEDAGRQAPLHRAEDGRIGRWEYQGAGEPAVVVRGVRKSPLFWPRPGRNSLPHWKDSVPLGMFMGVFIKPVQACTCSLRHT